MTPEDKVRSQRRNPSNARLEWRKLPPTRGLAGSGSRRLLPSNNNPSNPALRVVRERAHPPPRRTNSQSVNVRLEQARRRKAVARETIVRRRHRLEWNHRRVDDAERENKEASAELTRAEWAAGQQARAGDSVDVATSSSQVRAQPVHSRSDRLGAKLLWTAASH